MKRILFILLSCLFTFSLSSAEAPERTKEKALKGMELHSWQDPSRGWTFALLPGTNRLKTEAEVRQKENEIVGVSELERCFLRLAEGEEVFWFHRDLKGFAYPEDKVMKEVETLAKEAKVELHVQPWGTNESGAGSVIELTKSSMTKSW